jgi:2-polyprenyl-6-methoxyphenol hydroxylase-like FAD-dependent oxidoreductase
MTHQWERAIVMGGGVAGLVTARVLSDFFREVVLVERDPPPDGPHPRPGVPQAHHIHTLLARGRMILDKLYPGFDDDLAAQGILLYSWGKDTHILTTGGYLRRADLGIQARGHSRAMLEWVLRCRTEQISNIRILSDSAVTGLTIAHNTAVGVTYKDTQENELKADLIVDALGRNSPTIAWLEALGYPAPPETSVNPWMGYATRWYQLRPDQALDIPGVLIQPGVQPGLNRGAAAGRVEDRQVIITLLGMSRDYPPTDEAGFAEFARSLPDDTIQRWIETLDPISPIYGYRAVNRQRHFERLKRYPERFIVLGDASCALNPIYGQGMSVAALQANMLHDRLAQVTSLDGFARRFHRRLAHVNRIPWLLATSEDRRYPETEGTPPNIFERAMFAYIALLFRAASYDDKVARALLRTMQLVMHPAGLFHPRILLGAMCALQRGAASPRYPERAR